MHIQTRLVHNGGGPDPATGSIAPPLHLSTNFERSADGGYARGYIYTRMQNPNRDALELCLMNLDGGQESVAFASGTGAIVALLQALEPGAHAVLGEDLYFGTAKSLRALVEPWGVKLSFVDATDPARVKAALTPQTKLVFVESPSNPFLKITDLAALAEIARKGGARLAVDNTFATPVLQRPLELGADAVVYATTKYLNGHSDALGGAAVFKANDEFANKVRMIQGLGGGVPSPFDCWLLLRGLRTLPLRMREHCANAARVAAFLQSHPAIKTVHYPGLESHAGHAIARRQMPGGFGGMIAAQVKAGRDGALAAVAKAKVFLRATSLGGVESLIEHRASTEGPGTRTPDDLLRISVGIEHADDLIEDLKQMLG